jgi:uncharacterized protein (DUF2336 family)
MVPVAHSIERPEQADDSLTKNSRIEELLVLARDKSMASRNQLAEAVGELYFDDQGEIGEAERGLMTQILRRLIHEVEQHVRANLAKRMAGDDNAPRDLVTALANDDIEVAHAILVASNALNDQELVEIVEHRTRHHRLAIAMREAVSEGVSDALVGSGETDVVETLINNHGAAISGKTMEALVEASREFEAYQSPLLHRGDLSPRLARRMYWWVSAALRKHIANNYEIDSVELDSKIVSSVQDILGIRENAKLPADGLDELARKLGERNAISSQLLIDTLRQQEISLFEALFARLVGLQKTLVRRFVFEPGGESLAIACKAANIYKADFTSIFLLSRSARPGEKVVDPNELSRAVAFYDRITGDTARKVVERWHLDPDYLEALKKLHAAKTQNV